MSSRQYVRPSKPISSGPMPHLPDVHPDLTGFDVRLNPFGQVDMTISIDRLNAFLDREVADPKLCQWGLSDDDGEELGQAEVA